MPTVAEFIDRVLTSKGDAATCDMVCNEVRQLCERYPIYGHTAVVRAV